MPTPETPTTPATQPPTDDIVITAPTGVEPPVRPRRDPLADTGAPAAKAKPRTNAEIAEALGDLPPDPIVASAQPQATEQQIDEDLGKLPDAAELGLNDLLEATFVDDDIMQGTHKGLKWQEVLAAMPTDGKKLLQNMRTDYSRKTQELAQQRRELEEARTALTQRTEHEVTEANALFDSDVMAQLRKTAEAPEKPFDVYDEEGLEATIEQRVAKTVLSIFEASQQRLQRASAATALNQWVDSEAPELRNPDNGGDSEVRVAVHKRMKQGYNIRDAYTVVMAERDRADTASRKAASAKAAEAKRRVHRTASRQTSTGRRSSERASTFDPKNASVAEMAAEAERLEREGKSYTGDQRRLR